MDLLHRPVQGVDDGRDIGQRRHRGKPRSDPRPFEVMSDLVAHHVGLLEDLQRKRLVAVGRRLIDDHG